MTKELESRVSKLEVDMADNREVLLDLKVSFDKLNTTVEVQMENLIKALTGVNRIDVATLHKVVAIFGVVIIGLVAVIVFLLTGQYLGFVPKL